MQHSVTFIRDIHAKFDIFNLPQSPDIGQNSDEGQSVFHNLRMLHMYIHLLVLAYAWLWTCVRWEVCSFFSLWFFRVFKIFLALIILYCLKTCCIFDLYLFVLGRDRFFTVNIYFKETLFSDFSYKLFKIYFSLVQSTYQLTKLQQK